MYQGYPAWIFMDQCISRASDIISYWNFQPSGQPLYEACFTTAKIACQQDNGGNLQALTDILTQSPGLAIGLCDERQAGNWFLNKDKPRKSG